jgi:3-deoxy-D-manno-octulosonate 8-phosphate phosphatase (KDO 8-P phosphatase)
VTIHSKAAGVKLILLDVDGVLTDGTVVVHADGSESKPFAIRDGIALVWAQRVGLKVGILSARNSPTTTHRAAQLGITLIYQGVARKADSYQQILAEQHLTDGDVAYMGDDIVDLAVLERAGLSTAPADAVAEVRARVDWVSSAGGGRGAVREMVEMILRVQGQWDGVVASYVKEGQHQ